ncbi:hypothetical protein EVAR_84767_1 [Eumeta japonica]|uniref:Uncharacterized protein n=1 Tax=Eumeta variegata TaxID=151549 RepID=A0A4C1U8V1_EUMVA|nr:hypothetical protein EVAR_84767_1 [Eumeta japonica]
MRARFIFDVKIAGSKALEPVQTAVCYAALASSNGTSQKYLTNGYFALLNDIYESLMARRHGATALAEATYVRCKRF